MREVTKVEIKSANSKYCGTWTKADVEQEMKEADIEIVSSSDWLDYLFYDKIFDYHFFDEVEAACLESMKYISFYVDDDLVTIEKTFA